MKRRLVAAIAAVLLLACGGPIPAGAQSGAQPLRFATALPSRASGSSYVVRWNDLTIDAIDQGCLSSITWYYGPRKELSECRRVTTQFHDDFRNGFRKFWRPVGPFGFAWTVRREGVDGRTFVAGPGGAGPLLSVAPAPRDAVLSVLVRPHPAADEFAVGMRLLPDEAALAQGADPPGYLVRVTRRAIQVRRSGQTILEQPAPEWAPGSWYWLEIGIRNLRRSVELRLRLMDETRRQLLASLCLEDRPRMPALLFGGLIALGSGADYAEVYLDPWQARWIDDPRNEFVWDLSNVPDGEYYLVAEVIDEKNPVRHVFSDFRVQVRRALSEAMP